MARIRTIKPSFWTDPDVAGLTRDARLLTIGLISHADDEGRFVATAAAIGGTVFPYDDIPAATLKRWRDEVAKAGIVALYCVDGADYGHFPHWRRHQKVYKPYPSTLPPPPDWAWNESGTSRE